MKKTWIKRLFPVLAVLLLAPWPVAYAYDFNDGMVSPNGVRLEIAEAPSQPAWRVNRNAIGGVGEPIDLFYIDTADRAADTPVNLYLTNAEELIGRYRYMILNVGIYKEGSDGGWEKFSGPDYENMTEIFITLRDARVNFNLPGYGEYKITIDGGSYYLTGADNGAGGLSPRFYLTAD